MKTKLTFPATPAKLQTATDRRMVFPPPCPATTAERVAAIEHLRQKVNGHAEFMCMAEELAGSSAEAKEKAVRAFHDRMVALERQLARICEEFKLG